MHDRRRKYFRYKVIKNMITTLTEAVVIKITIIIDNFDNHVNNAIITKVQQQRYTLRERPAQNKIK